MTLEEKLRFLKSRYPNIYEKLCEVVPNLVDDPSNPSEYDLEEYNYWVTSAIEEDDIVLYHSLDD